MPEKCKITRRKRLGRRIMLTCRSKAQKQRYDSYARFKRTPTATLFQQLMDDAMANDALWLARNGN